ncbi:MAG: hypothetical protein GY751_13605 [Bacteroidetes bacterium]|nr:hypothetical protein [Bacteroidota bacterium]
MDIYKFLTTIILVVCLFISCDEASVEPLECDVPVEACRLSTVNHTEVPNLSFDEWNPASSGYYQPSPGNFWATPNEAIEFYDGGAVVERAGGNLTIDGEGYAAKLVTRRNLSPLSEKLPVTAGSIVSGRYATDLGDPARSIRFGRAFNRRISSLSGYYKYLPEGADACGMYLIMRTCSIVEDSCENSYGVIDTIAMDKFTTSIVVDEYTAFELEVQYDEGLYPDEVLIYFTSSDAAYSGGGVAGSVLFLDQLSVTYE